MSSLIDKELLYLNALNSISELGPKRIHVLLDHFGSAKSVWEALPDRIPPGFIPGDTLDRIKLERVKINPEEEWQKLDHRGISCASTGSPEYPDLLKRIVQPPPLIYFSGSLKMFEKPTIAIVGSRRCTFYGKEVAARLAKELALAGIGIVSGMALGVDTAAHQGALQNNGYTAAVLGCGLATCYPPGNKKLMEQISGQGAVISEFPLDTKPLPQHFPRRNRIISGLSLGTVVVEATEKSGALITANFALEQNREVFAVPGNIGSPYSRGCHRLIKEGAKLVDGVRDILEELYLDRLEGEQLTLDSIPSNKPSLTDAEKKLLELVPYQPVHIDAIVALSGSGAAEVGALLLSLELKGLIKQGPGKYFCRG